MRRQRSRRKIVCFPCRRYRDEPTQQHCAATFAAAPGAALSSLAAERKPNTDEACRRRLVSVCSLCVRRMSRTALLEKYLLSHESIVDRYRWPSASDKSTSSTDERPSRRLSNR